MSKSMTAKDGSDASAEKSTIVSGKKKLIGFTDFEPKENKADK